MLAGNHLCNTFNPSMLTILNPDADQNNLKVATRITNMNNRNTTTRLTRTRINTTSTVNGINQPRQRHINIDTSDLWELVLDSNRVDWNRKRRRWKKESGDY